MPGGSRRCCSRSIPYDANLPADAAERGPRRHARQKGEARIERVRRAQLEEDDACLVTAELRQRHRGARAPRHARAAAPRPGRRTGSRGVCAPPPAGKKLEYVEKAKARAGEIAAERSL